MHSMSPMAPVAPGWWFYGSAPPQLAGPVPPWCHGPVCSPLDLTAPASQYHAPWWSVASQSRPFQPSVVAPRASPSSCESRALHATESPLTSSPPFVLSLPTPWFTRQRRHQPLAGAASAETGGRAASTAWRLPGPAIEVADAASGPASVPCPLLPSEVRQVATIRASIGADVVVTVVLDTHCAVTAISRDLAQSTYPSCRLQPAPFGLKTSGGRALHTLGCIDITVWVGSRSFPVRAFVVPRLRSPLVLGKDWISASEVQWDVSTRSVWWGRSRHQHLCRALQARRFPLRGRPKFLLSPIQEEEIAPGSAITVPVNASTCPEPTTGSLVPNAALSGRGLRIGAPFSPGEGAAESCCRVVNLSSSTQTIGPWTILAVRALPTARLSARRAKVSPPPPPPSSVSAGIPLLARAKAPPLRASAFWPPEHRRPLLAACPLDGPPPPSSRPSCASWTPPPSCTPWTSSRGPPPPPPWWWSSSVPWIPAGWGPCA